MGGCASIGGSSTKLPEGVTVLYSQDDFRLGTYDQQHWYTPDTFNREMEKFYRRFDEAGMPGHLQARFKERLRTTYRMRFAMKSEAEHESAAFHYLWIQPRPGVRLALQPGAFLAEFVDPESGARQVVADHGALVWHWDGQDRAYRDSSRSTCVVDNDIQKQDRRRHVDVYLRFPPEYVGWKLVNVSLSPGGVQVHN